MILCKVSTSPPKSRPFFKAPSTLSWWNFNLPINPTKSNYIAIGPVPPLQLTLATRSPGDSLQVANVFLRTGRSHKQFLLTLHPLQRGCLQSQTKKAVVRWTIRARICLPPHFVRHWFGPTMSTLYRSARLILLPSPIYWSKSSGWRRGIPPTAKQGTTMLAESELLTQASPPRTYKVFSGGLGLELSLFFTQPVQPGLRVHSFKVLQGPSRLLWAKSSISIHVVKRWNRLPNSLSLLPTPNYTMLSWCL